MFIGDESGYIHKWDIMPVVKEIGFKQAASVARSKLSFNPKQNAFIDATQSSDALIFFAEQNRKPAIQWNSHGYVKQHQWLAHQAPITSIRFVHNPEGLVTCASDKHVIVWSLMGEMWGDINLMKENIDKKWTYPFDWSEKKEQEIQRVKKLMAVIEEPTDEEEIVFD